jgi:hypothetical protein
VVRTCRTRRRAALGRAVFALVSVALGLAAAWAQVALAQGVYPSRADFAKFLREDRARWGKIIRDAGITLE